MNSNNTLDICCLHKCLNTVSSKEDQDLELMLKTENSSQNYDTLIKLIVFSEGLNLTDTAKTDNNALQELFQYESDIKSLTLKKPIDLPIFIEFCYPLKQFIENNNILNINYMSEKDLAFKTIEEQNYLNLLKKSYEITCLKEENFSKSNSETVTIIIKPVQTCNKNEPNDTETETEFVEDDEAESSTTTTLAADTKIITNDYNSNLFVKWVPINLTLKSASNYSEISNSTFSRDDSSDLFSSSITLEENYKSNLTQPTVIYTDSYNECESKKESNKRITFISSEMDSRKDLKKYDSSATKAGLSKKTNEYFHLIRTSQVGFLKELIHSNRNFILKKLFTSKVFKKESVDNNLANVEELWIPVNLNLKSVSNSNVSLKESSDISFVESEDSYETYKSDSTTSNSDLRKRCISNESSFTSTQSEVSSLSLVTKSLSKIESEKVIRVVNYISQGNTRDKTYENCKQNKCRFKIKWDSILNKLYNLFDYKPSGEQIHREDSTCSIESKASYHRHYRSK